MTLASRAHVTATNGFAQAEPGANVTYHLIHVNRTAVSTSFRRAQRRLRRRLQVLRAWTTCALPVALGLGALYLMIVEDLHPAVGIGAVAVAALLMPGFVVAMRRPGD
jgi:hypothetical protein